MGAGGGLRGGGALWPPGESCAGGRSWSQVAPGLLRMARHGGNVQAVLETQGEQSQRKE